MKELDKGHKQKEVLNSIRRDLEKGTKQTELGITREEQEAKSITLPFRCSTKGNKYTLVLEKNAFSKKYIVIKVIKEEGNAPSVSNSEAKTEPRNIKAGDIDWNSIRCPYCTGVSEQDRSNVIKCSCNKLSCAGGVKDNYFVCPWCGVGGFIGEPFDEVTGSSKPKDTVNKAQKTTNLPYLLTND